MREDLYFLPIIARALKQAGARAALRGAFEHILLLGRQPHYRRGYGQFLHWMNTVRASRQAAPEERASDQLMEEWERPPLVRVVIERDGNPIATCILEGGRTASVSGIVPGSYRFRLDTGLLVWEGSLSAGDVLWGEAFPGKRVQMAAETEGRRMRPTRTIDLPEYGLVVEVYAELECGMMKVTWTPSEREKQSS